ncbi:tetratricopeptide repeat protein [Alkalimarinus sediminis]|uniref:Tetratricopeptide repeat protein n=1 Tax=Alkalimarinus sediminis TaxID=1632866 RepID=A0A9E8HKF6_9ALTE|nr:hypothetical protein [Alkalimarinus sediminis]UZW75782.1 hypothetical protein NNL22_04125 [Alkalimarinus sediminis]
MNTMTSSLKPTDSEFSQRELADMARLLIHANDLYQIANNAATSASERASSLDTAFELATQVVSHTPSNNPAVNLLGRIELDRGNIATAKALFKQCLRNEPHNTQYLTNLGYLYLVADESQKALEFFHAALSFDKGYVNAFLGIARAQQALRNFDVAYLHYRSLVIHGHNNKTILQGMLNCCEHIQVDRYETELEADLLTLFANDDLPLERLSHFAAQLICKKYDLENPNAPIDLLTVANDPLIFHALIKCNLPNPFVEEFITLLRQSILFEAAETRHLRDELQLLTIAIGVYCERCNYSLIVDEVEASQVQHFDQVLTQTLQQNWTIDDVAGALIVVGMYQAFFSQSYAVKLTALSLSDWPAALTPLMQASLYRRADREAFKQQFPEKQDELLIAKEDLPAPFPRWNNLALFNEQSLKKDLINSFNLSDESLPERLLLLVAGTDAAQKAVEYARYFTDVDVLAVEHSLENLAESHLKAQEEQLSNIAFWPPSLARRFLQDGNEIHFASISGDAKVIDNSFISLIQNNLSKNGVMNIKLQKSPDSATKDIQALVNKQKLRSTSANIRALRATILADKYSEYWSNLINDEYFYSIDGCRQSWFTHNTQQTMLGAIISLLANPEWTLSKVLNHHSKAVATALAKKHLVRFAEEQQVDNEYSIYLVKG